MRSSKRRQCIKVLNRLKFMTTPNFSTPSPSCSQSSSKLLRFPLRAPARYNKPMEALTSMTSVGVISLSYTSLIFHKKKETGPPHHLAPFLNYFHVIQPHLANQYHSLPLNLQSLKILSYRLPTKPAFRQEFNIHRCPNFL